MNIGDRKWLLLKLFIPDKYMKKYAQYLNGSHPYSVLIKRKDNDKGYDVRITIRVECDVNEGSRLIALDMNKSHIDFCVMDKNHEGCCCDRKDKYSRTPEHTQQ
nr:hypothetical protein [Methanophagales archaeon]